MKIRRGRPTVAEIDRAALRWNVQQVKERIGPKTQLIAIVKADAYGHGGPEVARILEKEGVKSLGVATVEEGVEIREGGVIHPEILVFGGFVSDQVEQIFQHRLTPVVCDIEMAKLLAQRLRGSTRAQPIHLKADTGLGRLGITLAEMPAFFEELKKLTQLKPVAVCSHLISATQVSGSAIDKQVASFVRAFELCAIHGSPVQFRHLANSAATLTRPDLHFEAVRPGIVLYGVNSDGRTDGVVPLRPAMKLRTQVIGIRRLPAGHGVGYDQSFICQRETRIATLPIGYADGYPRAASNRASMLVQGRRARVVGSVCMDVSMIDVTDIPNVAIGDEVVVWGKQGDEEIRVAEVAEWSETIPYEMLTTVGKRIPRQYIN